MEDGGKTGMERKLKTKREKKEQRGKKRKRKGKKREIKIKDSAAKHREWEIGNEKENICNEEPIGILTKKSAKILSLDSCETFRGIFIASLFVPARYVHARMAPTSSLACSHARYIRTRSHTKQTLIYSVYTQ